MSTYSTWRRMRNILLGRASKGKRKSKKERQLHLESLEKREMLSVSPWGDAKDAAGYWAFENGADDTSVNGLDGVIYGAQTINDGAFGNAMHFDGVSDYVSLGNPTALKITGEITLSAWIKPELGGSGIQNIVAKGHAGDGEIYFRINNGYYEIGSWSSAANYQGYQTSFAIPAGDYNNWVHLSAVYDGTYWQLYHNGIEVSATASPFGAVLVNADWAIGATGAGNDRFFKGAIDEVRIYDRALMSGEIEEIAAIAGNPTHTPEGPLGHWTLDNDFVNTANNSYGNGVNYNGVFVDGHEGNAISLDGISSYVNLGNPLELQIVGEITISAWIKPQHGNNIQNIVAKGHAGDGEIYFRINNGYYEIGSWSSAANYQGYQTSFAIPPEDYGNWVHLSAVYDGTYWILYRNGEPVAQTASAFGAVPVGADWSIGANGGGSERFFKGAIDEVRIYDRALTPSEVEEIAAAVNTPSAPAGYWTFENSLDNEANNSFDNGVNYNGVFVDGYDGKGISLNGTSSYVNLGNPPELQIVGTITISAWIKPKIGGDSMQNIVAKGYTYDGEIYVRINNGYYEIGSWGSGGSSQTSFAVPAGDYNSWVHLSAVYDGTYWRLYHNGMEVSSTASPFGAAPVNADWVVGANAGGNARFFKGVVDEVRIYDRALMPSEIEDIALTAGNATHTPDGPLGHWVLDNDFVNAADSSYGSGVNYSGTFVNGHDGNAISLDGTSSYVNIGNSPELQIVGEITLSAWIKPELGGSGIQNIVAKGYTHDPSREIFLRIENGRYSVGSWDGTVYSAEAWIDPADYDTWVHLTGTYDGTAWRLYKNGIEIAVSASAVGAVPVNADWVIGATSAGNERFFKGAIDEVRLYDRALTPAEVAEIAGVTASGPVGYWTLDNDVTNSADSNYGNGVNYGGTFVDGPKGDAISFDGISSYVSIGNPPELQIIGEITLSAWIKPEFGGGGQQNIVAKGYSLNPAGEVHLRINDGHYEVGSWSNAGEYKTAFAIPSEDYGNWVHLTGVYDGTYWRLYHNGIEVSATASNVGAVPVNASWAIGATAAGNERFFKGAIDEVRLYDRALTPQEIEALAGVVDNLNYTPTATWDFTPNNHGMLYGDIGGFDGTLMNGAQLVADNNGGGVLNLSGNNGYVTIGNPVELQITGEITLSAWIKPNSTTGFQNIIVKDFGFTPAGEIFLRINNGCYEIGSWNGGKNFTSFAIPQEDIGEWVHLTGVYDGTYWRLYRNGEPVAATASSVGAVEVGAVWTIGDSCFTDRNFDGMIADVRIFDAGVSSAYVRNILYTAPPVLAPTNTPPVAVDDLFTTTSEVPITLNVLLNDYDPDGGAISLYSFNTTSVQGVPLTQTSDGKIIYDPTQVVLWESLATGTIISDSFTYTIIDTHGATATATVTVKVTKISQGDIVATWDYSLSENSELILAFSTSLAQHFSEPERSSLRFSLESPAANGTAELFFNGALIYTPKHGFYGTDTIIVRVTKSDETSELYKIRLIVAPLDRAPTVENIYTATTWKSPVTVTPTLPNGNTISLSKATSLYGASVSLDGNGNIIYNPSQATVWNDVMIGISTTDQFNYTVTDPATNLSTTAAVYITVTRTGNSPTAGNDTFTVNTNSPVTFNVLANDTPGNSNDFLSILGPSTWTSALGAVITKLPGDLLRYDPGPAFESIQSGATAYDTFTYTISNQYGVTSSATVNVTLTKPEETETQTGTPITLKAHNDWAMVNAGQKVVIPVLANDDIPDGITPTIQLVSVSGGSAIVNAQNEIEYTAVSFYHGNYQLTYKLAYDGVFSENATVYVSIIGNYFQYPILAPVELETPSDTPIVISASALLANNYNWTPTGTTLTLTDVRNASNGMVQSLPNGDYLFTPNPGFHGKATLTYLASNGLGSDFSKVIIYVLPVNHAPVASDCSVSTYVDKSFNIHLLNYATDADGDPLSLVGMDTSGLLGTLTAVSGVNGTYRYSPDGAFDYLLLGASATETFTYTVTDPSGEESTGTVTITVSRQTAGISISSGGSSISSNVTDTQYYDSTFAVERTFTIYNNGSDVLQLDLTALRSLQLPASFEIVQYPIETVRVGGATTLRIRFDGSGDALVELPIGTNVPGMSTFTICHQETARPSSGKVEVSGVSISGVTGKKDGYSVGTIPMLTGTLYKDFDSTVGTAKVEFGLYVNGAWSPMGEVTVANSGDVFSLDISSYLSPGTTQRMIRYRVVTEIGGVTKEGSWVFYNFYLYQNPQVGDIRVDGLKITSLNDIGEVRFDPYVTGRVNGNFQSSNVKIEFAHTQNATTALVTISISQSGSAFCYDPWEYDAAFTAPKNGSGKVYYRLVVDGVAQAWQTYSLVYPDITGSVNVSFQQGSLQYPKENVTYVNDASRKVSVSGTKVENQYTVVRWDTDNDGVYDQVTEHLLGKESTFYPESLPIDTLLKLRAMPYFWSETHQLWVPGMATPWISPEYVVTSVPCYLNSISGTSSAPDDSPMRYAITGSIPTKQAFVRIAISKYGDGVADAYVYTDADGKFTYVPTDWELGKYYNVRATVCADDVISTGKYAWTLISTDGYSCEEKLVTLKVQTFEFDKENSLYYPVFNGKLDANSSYRDYIVEFDHTGNRIPDGRAVINDDGTFTYLAIDAVNYGFLEYRVAQWNPVTNRYVYGSWNSCGYQFTQPTLKITDLKLVNPTESSSRSSDPTIQGKLTGNRSVAYKKVEIETNGVIAAVYTDADGNFTYTPPNLQANSYISMKARIVEWDYTTQQESPGAWSTLSSFTLVGAATPSLNQPTLLFDTGGTPVGKTSIPTLQGNISNSSSCSNLIIEFYTKDVQNNRTILGYTTVDSTGKYYWTPNLETGQTATIYAQAKNYDAYNATWLTSSEQSLTIIYDPTHDTLATFADNPSWIFSLSNTNTTDAPYIKGEIDNDGDKSLVSVEFRIADNGSQSAIPLGVAQCDSDGYFTFYADNLPVGDVTIEYRVIEKTWNDAASVRYGGWQPWSVYIVRTNPTPQIVPGSLQTVNNLESSRILSGTDRPYILGQVHLEGADATDFANIQVEYKQKNNPTILGTTTVDTSGNFLLEISNPAVGINEYEFRPVYGSVQGEWTPAKFTWQASPKPLSGSDLLPVFGISSLKLNNNTGFTSSPTIYVDIFKPSSWSYLTIEWDINGNGKDIKSTTAYGNTSFNPAGYGSNLSYGPQTIYVRAAYGSGDNKQVSEWLPISFVYYGGSLSESQAITQYSKWAEEALRVSNDTLNTQIVSAAVLQASIKDAQEKYLLESSALDKSYADASLSASQQYRNALANVQTTHDDALQSAQDTFDTAITNFAGDKTSFTFQDFQWGSIPENYSFVLPTGNSPAPDYPSTNYASPEVSRDPLYISQLKAAQDAQLQSVQSASRAYNSTQTSLAQTRDNAYAEAYRVYMDALADAKNDYESTISQKMDDLYQRLNIAKKEDQYRKVKEAIIAWNSEEISRINKDFTTRKNEIDTKYPEPRNADDTYRYDMAMHEIARDYKIQDAQREYYYRTTYEANECQYKQLIAQYDYEAEPIRLEASKDRSHAENTAKAALEKAQATAKAAYETGLAAAEKTRAVQAANAKADLWLAEAQANESAIRRFYGSSTSSQATYEIALAVSYTKYMQSFVTSYRTWSQSEQNAIYAEKQAATAAWLTYTVGGNDSTGKLDVQYAKSEAVITATYQHSLANNRATFQRKMDEIQYAQDDVILKLSTRLESSMVRADLEYEMTCSKSKYTLLMQRGGFSSDAEREAFILQTMKDRADVVQQENDRICELFYNTTDSVLTEYSLLLEPHLEHVSQILDWSSSAPEAYFLMAKSQHMSGH